MYHLSLWDLFPLDKKLVILIQQFPVLLRMNVEELGEVDRTIRGGCVLVLSNISLDVENDFHL